MRSSEYRRLNKRQKQARWQQFNESQASKSAQLQDLARLRGAPSKKLSLRKHSFWSMNTMQTMLTPPPILASPPTEPPLPVSIPPAEPPAEPPPSISIPPVEPPAQPPKLTWRPPEDWRVTDSLLDLGIRGGSGIRRPIDEERAAAAGVDLKGMHWSGRSKALRWRERSEEKSQVEKAADARRKRVRRVELERDDREAMRQLARSRNDGTLLELEPTPAGHVSATLEP